MKNLKWLIELADTRPLLFSIALLLIGMGVMGKVILDRENKINDLNFQARIMENTYTHKIDSINIAHDYKMTILTRKLDSTLNIIVQGYKDQLIEQKNINEKITESIDKNKTMIQKNAKKLKNVYENH